MKPLIINNSMGSAQQTAGKLLVMVMTLLPLALPLGAWANPPLPVNVNSWAGDWLHVEWISTERRQGYRVSNLARFIIR
jgi:hypothetical protein